MATKSKKFAFGLLLFSATLILTWMHYSHGNSSSTTPVGNQAQSSEAYPPKSNAGSETKQSQRNLNRFTKVQLDLLETLAKQDIEVTSEDSSDYSSSDSQIYGQTDVNKTEIIGDLHKTPDLSPLVADEDVGSFEEVGKHADNLEDESSASESGFSEEEKWPWMGKTRTSNITTTYTKTRVKETSKKLKKLINCYEWNDREPDSWRVLPLKSEKDERQERVIFNRVGKCGSRTVIIVLRQLAAANNFNLISSVVYNSTSIDEEWQENLVHALDEVQTPFLFQRHLHYVDFTRYGSEQPLYINIIRDPLARLVSQYYFKRFGDGRGKERYRGPEDEKFQTFDDCVLQRKYECTGKKTFYIIPFFCGQERKCRSPSSWALETAIRNVEEKYVFVGILEEFEDTLAILERLLPSMFRKAVYFYKNPDEDKDYFNMSTTVTQHKKKPSPEVEQIMKAEMQYEYQFYNYVKNKFYRTRDMLGIKPST